MLLAVALMVGVVGAAPVSDGPGSPARPESVEVLQLAQVPAAANANQPAANQPAPGPDSFVVVAGYDAAFDRLAQEITAQLPKKKTLLVWVLDQSPGMEDDRDAIASRIDRLYQEVGKAPGAGPDDLMMGVVSYAAAPQKHTLKPTTKPQEVIAAIRAVKSDMSAEVVEKQCDAIVASIEAFRTAAQAGGRQLTLVLATDESGDAASNVKNLEATIKKAKERKCIVHVLGNETVFGYPYAHIVWNQSSTGAASRVRLDRGPETAQPEVLQTDGFRRREDLIPSGFGPYEQMRIASETGGIFFLLQNSDPKLAGRDAAKADTLPMDAEALRRYLPDLSSREKYVVERDKSKLRKALAKVVADFNPYPAGGQAARFEVNTGPLPLDPIPFKAAAGEQMTKAEQVIRYLEKAQKELEALAAERAQEPGPRWRANYDLLYAQVVSYQARLREYGFALAEFVKNPKNGPLSGGSRTIRGWYAVAVPDLADPTASQALKDKADGLFRAIETEYPGTPWARWAKQELDRGYGIELRLGSDAQRGRAGIGAPKP